MIHEILQGAGFRIDATYRQTVFLHPPTVPFVVFFDDVDADGTDDGCEVLTHDIRIELYSSVNPAPQSEKAIESELAARGLHYSKTGRTWIQSERYYMTVYDFSYIEKEQ